MVTQSLKIHSPLIWPNYQLHACVFLQVNVIFDFILCLLWRCTRWLLQMIVLCKHLSLSKANEILAHGAVNIRSMAFVEIGWFNSSEGSCEVGVCLWVGSGWGVVYVGIAFKKKSDRISNSITKSQIHRISFVWVFGLLLV